MRRLISGLWAMTWLTMFLVGMPAALVHYIGWPLPDHWPSHDEWASWVQQPLTRSAMIGTFAVLMWLLWAVLVYALVVEILTRVRRLVGWLRGAKLPSLPTPMQATASGMLGAAVFGMPTGTAHPPAPPVAGPPATAPTLPTLTHPPVVAADQSRPAVRPVLTGYPTVGERDPSRTLGVALPDGGWVTDDTARTIASAAAVVWWQRRRDYLPGPPTGAVRDDSDLTPLPATVTAVQDVLRGREHPTDDRPDSDDARGPAPQPAPVMAEPTPTVAATGAPIGPSDLPTGGVCLTGDGALAAARGILTAVLLSARPWHHAGDAQLITTTADLDTLLGPDTAAVHRATPGLTVVESLHDAIALLEQQILARNGLIEGNSATVDHQPPSDTAFPPVMLLTRGPSDHATAVRLAVLLLAAHLGVTGVLLESWPHGPTWYVDDQGYTHSTSPTDAAAARLCVLTPTATTDLLALLRQARPEPPRPPQPEPATTPGDHPDPGGASPLPRPRASNPRVAALTGRDPSAAPVRLRILGTPAVHRTGDAEPVPIRRTAALQILVYLAVHRAGAVSNELIAALWPGPRPAGAADRLYQPVSKLRSALREPAGADVIVRDGDRYRLDGQHIDVDLWRLHAAVDRAATAITPAERRRALHAVIDGYTGELAAGKDWSWLAVPREATRRHVVDAYVTLAADEPDPHTALALLQDAVRIDPVNADLRRRAQDAGTRATSRGPDRLR